jgi:HPr kinase/phosphorylase
MAGIRVETLLEDTQFDLRLGLLAGKAGLTRRINSARIQKPGLALAGFVEHIHKDRMQVFGNTEMSFLASLEPPRAYEVVNQYFALGICCLAITKNLPVPPVLMDAAERHGVPLLRTSHLSSVFIEHIEGFLEEETTAATSLHGVLVDVLGVGILILGKSGIGKSECALDLVTRGHRLVADDIVDIKRRRGAIHGSGSEIIKHHMEIRGLGIINIKDLFGISAVRERKKVEMVCELVDWDEAQEYDRLGIDEHTYTILDVEVPMVVLPVRPGRNLTTIIEVAARNHLLKLQGHHSAREFQEKLNREIADARGGRRAIGDEVE